MTKRQMVDSLIHNPAWDGTTNISTLMKYSKDEIKDMYDMIDIAEEEYYNDLYN